MEQNKEQIDYSDSEKFLDDRFILNHHISGKKTGEFWLHELLEEYAQQKVSQAMKIVLSEAAEKAKVQLFIPANSITENKKEIVLDSEKETSADDTYMVRVDKDSILSLENSPELLTKLGLK